MESGDVAMTEIKFQPFRTKLFTHGRSQALHLPEGFSFEGSEVTIRKEGDKVILEPVKPANAANGPSDKMLR
jgi:antitoxin VapB